jgi:hypothetical protein
MSTVFTSGTWQPNPGSEQSFRHAGKRGEVDRAPSSTTRDLP